MDRTRRANSRLHFLPLLCSAWFGLVWLCCNLIFEPWPPSCGVWQESGLAVWIGGHLQPLAEVPPAAAVMLITSFVAFFTEFASNTATIIIFLPVIAELVRPPFDHCSYWQNVTQRTAWSRGQRAEESMYLLVLGWILPSAAVLPLTSFVCPEACEDQLTLTTVVNNLCLVLCDRLQEGALFSRLSFEHLHASLSPSGHPSVNQPALLHDPCNSRLLLRLHAASVHATQLHRLRLGASHGQRHGNAHTSAQARSTLCCLSSPHLCSPLAAPQVKTGLVMNVLGILCVSLAINTWGVAMFNLTDNPDWAQTNKTTHVPAMHTPVQALNGTFWPPRCLQNRCSEMKQGWSVCVNARTSSVTFYEVNFFQDTGGALFRAEPCWHKLNHLMSVFNWNYWVCVAAAAANLTSAGKMKFV